MRTTDEIALDRAHLAATEADLREFEARYQMSTVEFFAKWQAGKMDDDMDFVEWASLAQMAEWIRERMETQKRRGNLFTQRGDHQR